MAVDDQVAENAAIDAGPIVVGVDGSDVSERALLWAAERAAMANRELRVVLARTHPVPVTAVAPEPVWPWPVVHQRDLVEVTETAALLEAAVVASLPEGHGLELSIEVVDGDPASGIIEAARDCRASLIVVGRRGRGGFKRLLLGSVSDECATYAPCSVAIISKHARWEPAPVVVVGVDGSESSDRALRWAARWATEAGSRLEVAHVWEAPTVPADSLAGTLPWLSDDGAALRDVADQTLAKAMAICESEFPDLDARGEAIEGYPSTSLTDIVRDRHASLLVLGTRGLGGFASMMLGSVAHQCLHHAEYPVVVVRPAESE